ncbi:MAG: hypothetical protein WC626_09780 [Methanoregula sp.]
MKKISINFIELKKYSKSEIQKILSEPNNQFCLRIPLPSSRVTESQLQMAAEYFDALFIGESIGKYCIEISSEYIRIEKPQYSKFVVLSFIPKNPKKIAEMIFEFSTDFIDTYKRSEKYNRKLQKFQLDLINDRIYPRLYELANHWMAYWIGGLNGTSSIGDFFSMISGKPWSVFDFDYMWIFTQGLKKSDLPEIRSAFIEHFEWQYGFWKAFKSRKYDFDYYESLSLIKIIPHINKNTDHGFVKEEVKIKEIFDVDLVEVPRQNFVPPKFYSATYFTSSEHRIVFNENTICNFPSRALIILSRYCAECISTKFWFSLTGIINYEDCLESIPKYYLSEEGTYLLIKDNYAQYLFFGIDTIPIENAEKILNDIGKTADFLKSNDISCSWDQITDDQFEELCYDILLQSERFNPDTIRKMGKSKSRDGGRDITIEESRFFSLDSPKKFIIQCKLVKTGISLSGSKINMSDTIDQYEAGGYIVMTNGVIDATLFDKLDAIAKKKKIKTGTWSKYEIERFLARRPDIKKRYFKNDCRN